MLDLTPRELGTLVTLFSLLVNFLTRTAALTSWHCEEGQLLLGRLAAVSTEDTGDIWLICLGGAVGMGQRAETG